MVGRKAPGLFLSQLSWSCNYRCMQLHLVSHVGADPSSGLHACAAGTILTESSLQSTVVTLCCMLFRTLRASLMVLTYSCMFISLESRLHRIVAPDHTLCMSPISVNSSKSCIVCSTVVPAPVLLVLSPFPLFIILG